MLRPASCSHTSGQGGTLVIAPCQTQPAKKAENEHQHGSDQQHRKYRTKTVIGHPIWKMLGVASRRAYFSAIEEAHRETHGADNESPECRNVDGAILGILIWLSN